MLISSPFLHAEMLQVLVLLKASNSAIKHLCKVIQIDVKMSTLS